MFPLQLLQPSIVPSVVKQTATIIFLHGLGDSGISWAHILPHLRPPHAKLICPNAPGQKVTLNGGMTMTSWFDLRPLDQPKDEMGIKLAAEAVQEVVQREIDGGIPASRIILGGFSQGGAVALYSGLTCTSYKLGGILALSTWLPLDKLIKWDSINQSKVLQCHGQTDDMIGLDRAEKASALLKTHLKDQYTFKTYPDLGHTINCDQELDDIHQFLGETLPELDTTISKSKL